MTARTRAEEIGSVAVGHRVVLLASHGCAGRTGTITNRPGRVFWGWTVRLDNGHYVGAATEQLRPLSGGTGER